MFTILTALVNRYLKNKSESKTGLDFRFFVLSCVVDLCLVGEFLIFCGI